MICKTHSKAPLCSFLKVALTLLLITIYIHSPQAQTPDTNHTPPFSSQEKVSSAAQTDEVVLRIGDQLPNLTINNIINSSTTSTKLSDYSGKLIIIDFWATWCSPCIAMLPKTDSLQKVFKDEVVFLPVTYESRDKVEQLFTRVARLKNITLPVVTSDTILRHLFPHKELPHYVWIGGDGIVKAITGMQEVNATNIRKALSNKEATLTEKRDALIKYNKQVPLLLADFPIRKEHLLVESVITRYIEGLPSRYDILRDSLGNIQRITAVNATYKRLFMLAYGEGKTFFGNNRIVLEVKDTTHFVTHEENRELLNQWLKENSLCYEAIVPPSHSSTIFRRMQQELMLALPQYNVSIEKRMRSCLVLQRTSTSDKLKSKGSQSTQSFTHTGATITNRTLSLLIAQLNTVYLQHLKTPIIDNTNYTTNIDLDLPNELTNVPALRTALKQYDLDLIPKQIEIQVLVIRDIP